MVGNAGRWLRSLVDKPLLIWWASALSIGQACFLGGQPRRVMMCPLLSLMIRPLTLGRATGKMRGA